MSRRPRPDPDDTDIEYIQRELARLTILLDRVRQQRGANREVTPRQAGVGDRVRFRDRNNRTAEGVIIAITPCYLRIRPNGSSRSLLQAPLNVVIIE